MRVYLENRNKQRCDAKSNNKSIAKFQCSHLIAHSSSGITLVALVVTIIVLLILAGITIAMLFGQNGIITNAQKAKEETEKAQENDIQGINNLEKDMQKALGNGTKWTAEEDANGKLTGTITSSDGQKVQIGDYVNYNHSSGTGATAQYESLASVNGCYDLKFVASDYTGGWRVLGVDENDCLLLISSDYVPFRYDYGVAEQSYTDENNARIVTLSDTSGETYSSDVWYYLYGEDGFENGGSELKNICSVYGQGNNATGARCVNEEDINKITGYNPNSINNGSGKKYGEGELDEYGNVIKYSWKDSYYPYYTASNGLSGYLTCSHNNGFFWYKNGWKRSAPPVSEESSLEKQNTGIVKTSLIANDSKYTIKYVDEEGPSTMMASYTDSEEEPELTSNIYSYYGSSYLDTESVAYKMLFGNNTTSQESSLDEENTSIVKTSLISNDTDYKVEYVSDEGSDFSGVEPSNSLFYWLSSSFVGTVENGGSSFGIRSVRYGIVSGHYLFFSAGDMYSYGEGDYYGVRPAVSLTSDIQLEDSGTQVDGCTYWNIK